MSASTSGAGPLESLIAEIQAAWAKVHEQRLFSPSRVHDAALVVAVLHGWPAISARLRELEGADYDAGLLRAEVEDLNATISGLHDAIERWNAIADAKDKRQRIERLEATVFELWGKIPNLEKDDCTPTTFLVAEEVWDERSLPYADA